MSFLWRSVGIANRRATRLSAILICTNSLQLINYLHCAVTPFHCPFWSSLIFLAPKISVERLTTGTIEYLARFVNYIFSSNGQAVLLSVGFVFVFPSTVCGKMLTKAGRFIIIMPIGRLSFILRMCIAMTAWPNG